MRLTKIYKQIPLNELKTGAWYVGRGRNGNVGQWNGDCFLVLGKVGVPVSSSIRRWSLVDGVKQELYYSDFEGSFQPFKRIDEGKMLKPFGEFAWGLHYGSLMKFDVLGKVNGKIRSKRESLKYKGRKIICLPLRRPGKKIDMSDVIQIKVGDVQVLGEIVHRSPVDLVVRIISPYKNIENGAHILHMVVHVINFISDYGDVRAKELLAEIFIFVRFMDENIRQVRDHFEEMQRSDVFLKKCQLEEERRRLRKLMRSGVGLPKDNQLSIMKINRDIRDLEQYFNLMLYNYLLQGMKTSVSASFVDYALKILREELDYIVSN